MKCLMKIVLLLVLLTIVVEVSSAERFRSYLSKYKEKNNLIKKFLKRKNSSLGPAPEEQRLLERRVLIDIKTVKSYFSFDNDSFNNYICSVGYDVVTDVSNKPVMINGNEENTYFFLCAKYQRYKHTIPSDRLVNTIEIKKTNSRFASKRCGSLKGASENIFKSSDGSAPYICFGEKKYNKVEDETKSIPIKHLIMKKVAKKLYNDQDYFFKFKARSYECLNSDLSSNQEDKVILCFTRQMKGIKKIEYKNMELAPDGKFTSVQGSQNYLSDEFRIDNGDGSDDLTIAVERTKSQANGKESTTTYSGGFGFEASISASYMKVLKLTLSVETSFNWGSSRLQTVTSTSTNSNKMECTAKAGKFYKCQQNISEDVMIFPVVFKKIYTTFDGKIIEVPGETKAAKVKTTNVTTKSCCYAQCSKDDELCVGAKIENKSICDASPGVEPIVEKVETTQKIEDTVGAQPVIVDITLNFSDTITCKKDYTKVATPLKSINGQNKPVVYLCVLKKKLSEIKKTDKETIINTIRFQYINNDCGSLKRAESISNFHDENISNNIWPVFMCFGFNSSKQIKHHKEVYPIIDLSIENKTDTAEISKDENILYTSHSFPDVSDKILKAKRQINIPKKIVISDYKIVRFERDPLEIPQTVDTITAAGSTVTRTIANTATIETSNSKAFEIGASVGVTFNIEGGNVGGSIGINANYNYSNEEKSTITTTNTDSQEIPCQAPAGKIVKCYIQKNKASITQHYTYTQTYRGYNGKKIKSEEVSGSSIASETKSLSITTCCEDGCCEGDAAKDAGKEQCFEEDGTTVKPADVKCSDYQVCLDNAEKVFEKKKEQQQKNPEKKKLIVTSK